MNNLKVGILMAGITALFVLCGNALGGSAGIIIAVVLALVMNIGTYWFSDKLVLKMTRAIPIDPQQAPELHEMVQSLSRRAGIPTPRLYLVPDASPNAFATGRNPANGVVAVNQGLLDILNREEVEGVIAHEIAHIKHRDTLTSAIVATMAGAISSIANMAMFASMFGGGNNDEEGGNPLVGLLLMIVAPLSAMLIQLGISRAREYEADKTAAQLVGSGRGLQNALIKLHKGVNAMPGHMSPTAAHMCIVNPFGSLTRGMASLFSTHPPMEERVRRLEALRG
ncbi:MAG: zinc metalloprotease HtpX [Chthonomonas sp.]|nr:zinc metalloprotease HtpX [Chthonomonas sp.]